MVRVTVRGDALREHRVASAEVHHDMHRVELDELVDPMPDVRVQWIRSVGSGNALVRALRATELSGGLPYVGAGCETAELKVIRRYLRAARDIPRSHTELVGYWRRGQPSD